MAAFIISVLSLVLVAAIWTLKKANGDAMFTNYFKWSSIGIAAVLIVGGVYLNQVVSFLGFGFLIYKVANGVLTALAAWPYVKKARKYVLNETEDEITK